LAGKIFRTLLIANLSDCAAR